MKKIFTKSPIVLVFLVLLMQDVSAQLASGMPHLFSVTQATPPAVPTTPTPVVNISLNTRPAAVQDEFDTLIAPTGWTFTFAGQAYTKFVVSTNGWIALIPNSVGVIPPVFAASAFPNNQLNNNTTGYPMIAPLWDDLTTLVITYTVNPANVLWVRWTSKFPKTNPAAHASLCWAKLDGTNNTITFYYANNSTYNASGGSASIGIAGSCVGDYYSAFVTAFNTAYVDSVFENTNIAVGPSPDVRPYNCSYTFTPYNPADNCAGNYPARDLGTISGTCSYITASTFNAGVSGAGICATSDDNDVWFRLIKPNNATNVTVTTIAATCQSVSGTSIEVYAACGGASLGCATTSTANPNFAEVSLSRPCAAETLYVRVTADGDVPGKFQICGRIGGAGTTCANSTLICSLPYTLNGATTAGSGNEYDSTNSACHTIFMNGEDYVFSYTPTVNQCIRVSLNSTGDNPGVFVYSGCPNAAGTYCLASSEVATGNAVINSVSLVAGQTYYIVVDNGLANGNTNIPFDINVTTVGTTPSYDPCSGAFFLGNISNTVSCVPMTFSTECATPTPAGVAGLPTCVPTYNPPYFIDGVTGDVWLRFTVSFSGSLQINTFQSAVNPTSNAAMAIYSGASCPTGGASIYACDYNSGPNGMPSLSIPVANGSTYYIRIWTEHPERQGNFDICFQSACAPPNDLPCNSIFVPLGGIATGFNTCAGNSNEPANAAQCIAGGTANTVWFSAIVPPSGSIRVRTNPLTLTDTQIQGYSFPTGCANAASSNVSRGCNVDGTPCSGGFSDFSEQLFTGLTPGDTLYVAVDGVNSLTGSFNIAFINGNSTVFPPVTPQDCGAPQIICSTNSIVVANPGYRNNGNICDLPTGYGCWFTGERNSVWYQFTVDPALSGGTATLAFDIFTPSSVDIDILIWDVTGNSNPCPAIQAQTYPIAACNYAGAAAATGLSVGGTGAYSPAIVFSGAPRTYLMLLNNWNSSANAGFTLDWTSTPISTTASNSTWTGFTDNLFTTPTNWGECGSTPSCAVDAIINSTANGRQPNVLAGPPAKSVRNITINAGATLTIQAGATLNVCGNFTNNGTLICQPGSTIQFIGNTLQTISGNLTGANSFANLVINKLAGSVQLQTNIDVAENFSESNATSWFDINGRYMKVAGNFTNWNGGTTFFGIGGSTVEFNGDTNQFFTNLNGVITLNRVVMNKTGGKLYLNTATSSMNIDSALTLNTGIIVGPKTVGAQEVNMKNWNPGAITGHNANSFVNGRLRRKISTPTPSSPPLPANYDFPVGDSLVPGPGTGYNNAKITFITSTLVNYVTATFRPYPAPGPPLGPAGPQECFFATYNSSPLLDNGFWSFERPVTPSNGIYHVTLYNTGYTNNVGNQGHSVVTAALAATPTVAASWSLFAKCNLFSTINAAVRDSLNAAAYPGSFNHHYATAQSISPLPIELLYFNATPKGDNVLCKWETASETNNQYFDVERSDDGINYSVIGSVRGFGPGISTERREYELTDYEKCDRTRYYRLKQVDIDGMYTYSDAVAVDCKKSAGIKLYPNPAYTYVKYQFSHDTEGTLQAEVLDIAGRTVMSEVINVERGFNAFTLNIEELSAGAYYLRISDTMKQPVGLQKQFFKK